MYRNLDKINCPGDLRNLDRSELQSLCSEIRDYMVDCCSRNPGHLASSLGAVEIITGLHFIFNTPEDKIVFDVGHQAYAHKILTERKGAFTTIRTEGGLSGFPKMSESPYDPFGVGHSSTSISAALGIAEAARIRHTGNHTIAVIGDGALTGGLAFEGLNNAGVSNSDLLIILNDNNHSIDNNTGGLHNHLLKITTNPAYNRIKAKVWDRMGETKARGFFQRWAKSLKSWFVKGFGGDLFESLGIRYFGPIDGNDIYQVIDTLAKLKDIRGPRILHCITRKGKGYSPAEQDPTSWHAPGKFNPETGERIRSEYKSDRFQDVFGEVLVELAKADDRVVGVTPAMATGCGMNRLAEEMPERFYDVGIEEEHAVTFSAGLAAGGLRPFCNIYSSFSQRAYDQIIHDVALQGLPVVLCFDRAGLVGEDGATHQGVFDMAAYRSIPGLTIMVPRNEVELKMSMFTALRRNSPTIIRYPRGTGDGVEWRSEQYRELPYGRAEKLRDGSDAAIIAAGPCASRALEAAGEIHDINGKEIAVYNIRYLKPIDKEMLEEIASRFDRILTVEDGTIKGGLYGEVSEHLCANKHNNLTIKHLGVEDHFVDHARQSSQRHNSGIDSESIRDCLMKLF